MTADNTAPERLFVAKNPPITGGVTHGGITVAAGTSPVDVAKYATVTKTIGVRINGINITGFKTIGRPNIVGSLMLKTPGAIDKFVTTI